MLSVSPASLMALAIAMMNICIILIILRLVGRRMQRLHIGADDILAICACVGLVAMCINMITAVAYRSWGVPLVLLTPSKDDPEVPEISRAYIQSALFVFAQELILPVQLMFAKLSILFFYRRLLCVERHGAFHWATLVTIIVTLIWSVTMFFLFLFQCGPNISNLWNPSIAVQQEACSMSFLELIMAGSDMSLDLIIVVLPVHRLSRLQVSLRKKAMVIGVFATGALSLLAVVIRTYVYASLFVQSSPFRLMNANMILSLCMFWGLFESAFAVIAACLPSVKFFIDRASSKISGSAAMSQQKAYNKTDGSSGSSTPREPEFA